MRTRLKRSCKYPIHGLPIHAKNTRGRRRMVPCSTPRRPRACGPYRPRCRTRCGVARLPEARTDHEAPHTYTPRSRPGSGRRPPCSNTGTRARRSACACALHATRYRSEIGLCLPPHAMRTRSPFPKRNHRLSSPTLRFTIERDTSAPRSTRR